jgi:hypothetical protein
MKVSTRGRVLAAAMLVVAGAGAASAQQAPAGELVRVGAAVGGAEAVSLRTALADPDAYIGRQIQVEGLVTRACTSSGCWMQLAPNAEAEGVRVTFKDYAFFIPLNSAGMRARAQGEFTVKRLSRREVEHLNGEGASIQRARDGSAIELSFVAAGVELRR